MSDAILPQTPTTNIRKWIFIITILIILFGIIAFFVFMSGRGGKTSAGKGFNPDTNQVLLWTVGLDKDIISELNNKFNKYLGTNEMKLVVQNFGSFEDYIDILPRAMQSETPPDIVMVPNHGGNRFFDQYINALGDNLVDFTDFEDRFHKLFSEELVFTQNIEEGGQKKVVKGLRGVPFGFEPMGIYYNRDLVHQAPTLWKNLESIVKDPGILETDGVSNENPTSTLSEDSVLQEKPAFSNLGYGRATPVSPDIIALLIAQRKGPNFGSYANINSIESRAIFEDYLSFRREPNNLKRFDEQFAKTLTTTDLFVRGKIATLIGYPSTYEDIKVAMQRAQDDRELFPNFLRNLRVATVPQEEIDPKKHVNFARYTYFALTKNGVNRNRKKPQQDPVLKFVQFLLTSEAQNTFMKHPSYSLPTQNTALINEKDTKINPDANFAMTIGDWYVAGQTFALYDMGFPHLYRSVIREALDEPGTTAVSITAFVSSYLSCKVAQLTDPAQYSRPCYCQTALPANKNNYWPLCGQE